jgi:predicted nucleic acid-binding protein
VILVDTNIVFSLLIENDRSELARTLMVRDDDWRAESHSLVELTNVLTRYVRARELTANEATMLLTEAEDRLRTGLLVVAHADALRIAIQHKISAYDARFLVAAEHLGVPLVTEDQKLRKAAPELTQSLTGALAAV